MKYKFNPTKFLKAIGDPYQVLQDNKINQQLNEEALKINIETGAWKSVRVY